MIMRSKYSRKILLVFYVLSFISCGRNLSPAVSTSKTTEKFDTAAFNYVYVEAIKQKLMGNGGEALKDLEQCIKMNHGSDASYYQMAQIVIANGDLSNGKHYALKALAIDKENVWYLTMLAGLYYQEKGLDSAIYYYEKAVKYFPDQEKLLLTLGNLYSENKSYEKANLIFESFDKKYGINETSTLSTVKNLIAEGKLDEAMSKTLSLLKQSPDEIMYNGILADIYRGKGENQKALEVYNDLIVRNPDNPQIQLSLCDFLISEKSYDDLFVFLNTVILNGKVERENKISLMARLIETPELSQKYGDKMVIALMVLEANYSEDSVVPLLRPDLLIRQNKLKEAADRLEEIIKATPENYYAWEKVLIVYLQMKDYKSLFARGEDCATKFNRSFPAKI